MIRAFMLNLRSALFWSRWLVSLGQVVGGGASAATLYVWQGSPCPTAPFSSWATAATSLQQALDAAQPGDTVLATNGVYAVGGRVAAGTETNRVVVNKPVTLLSVNGPAATSIEGAPGDFNADGAIR